MSNCAVCHKPLTIEELREMVGEPVYVEYPKLRKSGEWEIISGVDDDMGVYMTSIDQPDDYGIFDTYGESWLAYRRKPNDWISVKDRLPENEQAVLACAEVRFDGRTHARVVVPAFYTDGTTKTDESNYCWDLSHADTAYDEERDAYIIPEGWWEIARYTDEFAIVSDFVTHWLPMPALPEVGT